MKQAIFFDVDDTVYDHLIPFRKAVQSWAAHIEQFPYEAAYHRMRYYSDLLSHELGGAGQMEQGASTELMRRRRFQLALQEFSLALTEQEAEKIQQAYLSCQFEIECFAGMKELIQQLQARGVLVGLLTNGAEAHQRRKIEALGLDKLVANEHIFISGAYGIDKPDPRIFQLINKQTGTNPAHCTYVGDSWRNDVVGAHRAGWSVVWFNHRQQQRAEAIELTGEATNLAELYQFLVEGSKARL